MRDSLTIVQAGVRLDTMGSVSFAYFLWVDNNPISDYNAA